MKIIYICIGIFFIGCNSVKMEHMPPGGIDSLRYAPKNGLKQYGLISYDSEGEDKEKAYKKMYMTCRGNYKLTSKQSCSSNISINKTCIKFKCSSLLDRDKFKFFFYKNESKPKHVHVTKNGRFAKIGLKELTVFDNNLRPRELKRAIQIVKDSKNMFEEKWNEWHGSYIDKIFF